MNETDKPAPHSDYAPANIFVGKYDVPADGWVKLDDAHVLLLHQVGERQFAAEGDGPLWLIVEDGNFWPVMIQLSHDDLGALRPGKS